MAKAPECHDCIHDGVTTWRPVEGVRKKRCTTHRRAQKSALSQRRHDQHVERTYGITSDQYAQLYAAQGGRCFICRRATGKTRRLSVDHDHKTGEVRALLCRPCNDLIGHARDDVDVFVRAINHLEDPIARRVLDR